MDAHSRQQMAPPAAISRSEMKPIEIEDDNQIEIPSI